MHAQAGRALTQGEARGGRPLAPGKAHGAGSWRCVNQGKAARALNVATGGARAQDFRTHRRLVGSLAEACFERGEVMRGVEAESGGLRTLGSPSGDAGTRTRDEIASKVRHDGDVRIQARGDSGLEVSRR